ncbi:hypothetical protein ZWY2020_037392 [Hordeum vulgare]|nr:hypothetical protein ZWY2020_037392 [Hordeum vulgare]
MKLLQDLVPGCNKVVGKAVMLDEIINYAQSLQRQVENELAALSWSGLTCLDMVVWYKIQNSKLKANKQEYDSSKER